MYKECAATDFTCGNRRCIALLYVCDGDDDCFDGTDEAFCFTLCSNISRSLAPLPSICQNLCKHAAEDECLNLEGCSLCEKNVNGKGQRMCYPTSRKCDGEENCQDGSDEKDCEVEIRPKCEQHEFQCNSSGFCIMASFRCDGSEDCLDNSDEEGCGEIKILIVMGLFFYYLIGQYFILANQILVAIT